MIKSKRDVLCLAFVPVVVGILTVSGDVGTGELYGGVVFGANIRYQMFYFMLFFGRVLYTFGDFEDFFGAYGIYQVIRHGKREFLFRDSVRRIVGKVLCYQVIALFCSLVCSRQFLENGMHFKRDFILELAAFWLTDLVLALGQMLVEMVAESRMAMIVSAIYFLLSLIFMDMVYFLPWGKMVLWIFLPNLAMGFRVKEYGYSFPLVYLFLLVVLAVFCLAGIRQIRKKDVL